MTATDDGDDRPEPRSMMSIALPMWLMSELPMLTTSPVDMRLGRVAPIFVACPTVSWIVLYAAFSQL